MLFDADYTERRCERCDVYIPWGTWSEITSTYTRPMHGDYFDPPRVIRARQCRRCARGECAAVLHNTAERCTRPRMKGVGACERCESQILASMQRTLNRYGISLDVDDGPGGPFAAFDSVPHEVPMVTGGKPAASLGDLSNSQICEIMKKGLASPFPVVLPNKQEI